MDKLKILYIDDETFNLDALKRLFRKKYDITTAESGSQALEIMKENDFDVIVSDQRMPKMTGVETLKKSLSLQPFASRVLLTGYTDLDSVIASINEAKIHMYLTKPWDQNQLGLSLEQAGLSAQMRKDIRQKNEQLKIANENLKSLDKAKTNFMTMINHELKTPLTTISSYLQMLKEECSDDLQSYTAGIQKGYDRLEKLTRLSLIIMEAKNGLLKTNVKKINLQNLLEDYGAKLAKEIEKKNLSIKYHLKETQIKMDPELAKILFYELFENAIRYALEKSEITLSFDGSTFEIKNSGNIPKKKLSEIFTPYYVDESIMNHSNSTGLGISVSQAILNAHKSELTAKSENKEVIFYFTIK